MKIAISRTTGNQPPCEEAVEFECIYIDYRTVKTLQEMKHLALGKGFFSEGINHREEKGMVARDMPPRLVWCVEINTLDDITNLREKYDEDLIITSSNYKGMPFKLEINDDYRY